MKRILLVAAGVSILIVGAFATMSWYSQKPVTLGIVNGRLSDCPDTPNCVSTQAVEATQRMEPIAFAGSAEDAMQRLRDLISNMPRATIRDVDGHYLHAEFRSRIFRFVDDVEFLIDAESRVIHFRSASRVGHSDLGANRRRMESIGAAFLEKEGT